jgi:ProP effector
MHLNQQDSAKKEKRQIIDWLIENFPAAFFKTNKQIKPLKLGIFDDIMDFYERLDAPPFSKKAIRDAISYYSASPAYLGCQKTDTARVDLFGNEVDIVTEEQAKYAYQRFQQRYGQLKTSQTDTPT